MSRLLRRAPLWNRRARPTACRNARRALGNGDWSDGRLKLPSGDAITLAHAYRLRWEGLVGAEITVVAKVLATGERPGEAPPVSARSRCKGRVERCSSRL